MAVINMLIETAVVKLKPEVAKANLVAKSLAQRLNGVWLPDEEEGFRDGSDGGLEEVEVVGEKKEMKWWCT